MNNSINSFVFQVFGFHFEFVIMILQISDLLKHEKTISTPKYWVIIQSNKTPKISFLITIHEKKIKYDFSKT